MASSGQLQARVPPLTPAEIDSAKQEFLGRTGNRARYPGSNWFLTLVRHPDVYQKWVPYVGQVHIGLLPARDREILILRVLWRCQCRYGWAHHSVLAVGAKVSYAPEAGSTFEGNEDLGWSCDMDSADLQRIQNGPNDPGWSPFDATLVRACDELVDDRVISDATWQVLAERYDDKQLIEIPMLVGAYWLAAVTINSLGVPLEPDVPDGPGMPT